MSQRKRLDRDGLEVYLLNLLLLYRPLLRISAGLLFLYGMVTTSFYPLGSMIAVTVATFLILLTISDALSLRVARFGAWLSTLRKKE